MKNATGSFGPLYPVTLLYRIPLGDRYDLKVCGWGGIYKTGKLAIDAAGVTNWFHDVIEYKNASGAHAVVDFELTDILRSG